MHKVDPQTIHTELKELAKRIKDARKSAHLSQLELGNYIGVSDKSVSSYEKGRSIPPFEKLKRIAEYTKLPIQYFTEGTTEEVIIANKLKIIEYELEEIKKLLKKTKK